MLWPGLLLLTLVLVSAAIEKGRRALSRRARRRGGTAHGRRPLQFEALAERIVPSVLPSPLRDALDGVQGQVRSLASSLDEVPAALDAAAGPLSAGEAPRPPCGVRIQAPGVQIEAFGSDARTVQLILLSAAGLLWTPRRAEEEPEKKTGAAVPVDQRLRRVAALLPALAADLAALHELLPLDVPSSLNKIRFIAEKVLHQLCVC